MAKNIVKHSNPGMERGMSDMDSRVSSGNLQAEAAHSAPLKSNAKREQPHLGAKPRSGSGKF